MIATIINAEPHLTKIGRTCIKLDVIDDYEVHESIFIAIGAIFSMRALVFFTKIPLINKRNNLLSLNLEKMKGKIIPVREHFTEFNKQEIRYLSLDLNNHELRKCPLFRTVKSTLDKGPKVC